MKKRILTGIRPTGPLHLGHYVGALENWLKLENEYECFFLIADYQALGDYIDDVAKIREAVVEVALDWLAVGLDPEKSAFSIQSYIPEHSELTVLLSMLVPLGRLQRNPTLKSEMETLGADKVTLGFFNYPVSQIADILLPKANLVPVGEDQNPHVELTREIARKFNENYGEVFPIPEAKIGRVPRLVGIDGTYKMSKSRNNSIYLKDSAEIVKNKVMQMYTDPTRKSATDPGHIEGNPVFDYHDHFNTDKAEVADLKERYVAGKVGDVEVKEKLAVALNIFLDPIRTRREKFAANKKLVIDALAAGTQRERKIAAETMQQVRDAMKITNYGK